MGLLLLLLIGPLMAFVVAFFRPGCLLVADRCLRCGRRLKDPVSMARGYGAVCFRKLRLRKSRRRKRMVDFDWRQLDLFRGPMQQELF